MHQEQGNLERGTKSLSSTTYAAISFLSNEGETPPATR
jgi:hypothetical protein